jgi:hypothetical protein
MLPVFGFTVGSFNKDMTREPSGCQCSDYEHGSIQGCDTMWSGKDIQMFQKKCCLQLKAAEGQPSFQNISKFLPDHMVSDLPLLVQYNETGSKPRTLFLMVHTGIISTRTLF